MLFRSIVAWIAVVGDDLTSTLIEPAPESSETTIVLFGPSTARTRAFAKALATSSSLT
mgnify:FL=1